MYRLKLTILAHVLFLAVLFIFNYGQYISLKQSSNFFERLAGYEVKLISSQLEAVKDSEIYSIIFDQVNNFSGSNQRPLRLVKLNTQALSTSYKNSKYFESGSLLKNCWLSYDSNIDICSFIPASKNIAGAAFLVIKIPKKFKLEHVRGIPLTKENHFRISIRNENIDYSFLLSTEKTGFNKLKDDWENKVIATKMDGTSKISAIIGSTANIHENESYQYLISRINYEEIDPNNNGVWPPINYKQAKIEINFYEAGDPAPKFSNTENSFGDRLGVSAVNLDPNDPIRNKLTLGLTSIKKNPSVGEAPEATTGFMKKIRTFLFDQTVKYFNLYKFDSVIAIPVKINDSDTMMFNYDTSTLRTSHDNRLKEIIFFTVMENIVLITFYILVSVIILRKVRKLTKEVTDASSINNDDFANSYKFKYVDDKNEIGILTREFSELIERLRKNYALDKNRIQTEISQREFTLRQIGHEIKSPMQALIALGFTESSSAASKYLVRMSRAISHLMNGNALSAMPIDSSSLDLVDFLRQIEANAHLQNIEGVVFITDCVNIYLNVDAAALEDAVTHILNNASRFKYRDSNITITLNMEEYFAVCKISNTGPLIPNEKLEEIFEYGISSSQDGGENLGQGLFVAKDYITRMGGTIRAYNTIKDVVFEIKFPLSGQIK